MVITKPCSIRGSWETAYYLSSYLCGKICALLFVEDVTIQELVFSELL